jgi:hypothetical protein
MAEFFRFLVESNLTTAAFVIGAIAFIIAIIGRIKTIIEPSPTARFILALFGLLLMGVSAASYSLQSSEVAETSGRQPQQPPTIIATQEQPLSTPASGAQEPLPTLTTTPILTTRHPTSTPSQQVPPATAAPTRTPSRPSGVTVPVGGEFSPIEGWIWICTGDFALIRTDGAVINLFDDLESTGLIVVFAENSKIRAFAPYGGYCEPFSPEAKDTAVASKISTMLTSPMQCQGGCSSVNIIELNQNGEVVRDFWKP